MQVHARDAFALISTPVLPAKPLFSMTALILSGCASAESSVQCCIAAYIPGEVSVSHWPPFGAIGPVTRFYKPVPHAGIITRCNGCNNAIRNNKVNMSIRENGNKLNAAEVCPRVSTRKLK